MRNIVLATMEKAWATNVAKLFDMVEATAKKLGKLNQWVNTPVASALDEEIKKWNKPKKKQAEEIYRRTALGALRLAKVVQLYGIERGYAQATYFWQDLISGQTDDPRVCGYTHDVTKGGFEVKDQLSLPYFYKVRADRTPSGC